MRMVSLLRLAAEARAWGVECSVQQPHMLKELHPHLRTGDLVGGVFLPGDGVVDTVALCQTLADLAQEGGAQFVEECQVQRVLSEKGVVVGAETELGNIACEYFILAGGMLTDWLTDHCCAGGNCSGLENWARPASPSLRCPSTLPSTPSVLPNPWMQQLFQALCQWCGTWTAACTAATLALAFWSEALRK